MAPSRQRLVRRQPLLDRVKAYINPLDWLIWLSEELNNDEWEDFAQQWAWLIGLLLNLTFMIAQSNSRTADAVGGEDVFADYDSRRGSGWLSWFATFLVHILTLVSCVNAFVTFFRRRHYRLFESSVEQTLNSPSARRVPVESSPISVSSPIGFVSRLVASSTAQARSHPDARNEVWELAVWDPNTLALRIFCLFSPGHVLVYWLFLPLQPLDPRPSVTVATTIALVALLSLQLLLLEHSFSQQTRDRAIVNQEVQQEYDTKYVNATLNKPVRDAGTQMRKAGDRSTVEVMVSTPKTYINRGFQTNPNPNYISHLSRYNSSLPAFTPNLRVSRSATTPAPETPADDSSNFANSSPLASIASVAANRQGQAQASQDEGSFGVYSHARSPLKKSYGNNLAAAARIQTPLHREGSPLKRSVIPGPRSASGSARVDRRSRATGENSRKDINSGPFF